jgi:hypothetical protein
VEVSEVKEIKDVKEVKETEGGEWANSLGLTVVSKKTHGAGEPRVQLGQGCGMAEGTREAETIRLDF